MYSEHKEKQEKAKGELQGDIHAHFINLVNKEYFSYNVLQFFCCMNNYIAKKGGVVLGLLVCLTS